MCNQVRCHNAVVTKANAPKWRAIYVDRIKLVGIAGYEDRQNRIVETLEESKRVLEYLGEKAKVASLTGLHRNSFSRQGTRYWVGVELNIITQQRQEELTHRKITSKKEDNLQTLLNQSKLETLHCFTFYSESERKSDKLRNRLKYDTQSRMVYQN